MLFEEINYESNKDEAMEAIELEIRSESGAYIPYY